MNLLALLFFVHCREKDQGIPDRDWQEESLRLAGEICLKIKHCGEETGAFQGLNPTQYKILDRRFTEATCKEYHRDTNVFLLRHENPEVIKTSTRECYKILMEMDCLDFTRKKYLEHEPCVRMQKIQQTK